MKKIELTSIDQFEDIVNLVLTISRADDTRLFFSDAHRMTTRFANNEVIQNVSKREPRLVIEVAFGRQVGRVALDHLDLDSLKSSVTQAENIAQLSPEDPEYLPPLGPQQYLSLKTYSHVTAGREPKNLANHVKDVTRRCNRHRCEGAGIISVSRRHVGVATSNGLQGFEQRTRATYSLTATLPNSTGWTMNNHRKISKLDIDDRTRMAISKAEASANPREIPAGRYDVILEPSAVAGLVGPMIWNLSAKNYFKGNSPYSGKLNKQILDPRLQIASNPENDALLGTRFDDQGLPHRPQTYFDHGVLKQLVFDRFTAAEHDVAPAPAPNTITIGFQKPTYRKVDDLIERAERAILVTNFWYIRFVNRTDLTLTGMTRDGTFLIENGKIVGGVKNFRFHESPLNVLQNIAAVTAPTDAVTNERSKMLAPYMHLRQFNFSSVTRF